MQGGHSSVRHRRTADGGGEGPAGHGGLRLLPGLPEAGEDREGLHGEAARPSLVQSAHHRISVQGGERRAEWGDSYMLLQECERTEEYMSANAPIFLLLGVAVFLTACLTCILVSRRTRKHLEIPEHM